MILESINVKTFKKEIKDNGIFEEFALYPYFSNENKPYGRVVVISDKVETSIYLTDRKKKLALIIPYSNNNLNTLKAHKESIKNFVGVEAPVFSYYDLSDNKIGQI